MSFSRVFNSLTIGIPQEEIKVLLVYFKEKSNTIVHLRQPIQSTATGKLIRSTNNRAFIRGILDLHKIIVRESRALSVKNYRNTRHSPKHDSSVLEPLYPRTYNRTHPPFRRPHFSIFLSACSHLSCPFFSPRHPRFPYLFSSCQSFSPSRRSNLSPLITRSRKFVHISVSHPPLHPLSTPSFSFIHLHSHPFLSFRIPDKEKRQPEGQRHAKLGDGRRSRNLGRRDGRGWPK